MNWALVLLRRVYLLIFQGTMPMSVNNLLEIVDDIKSGMPPETLFSSKDAALFIANKDLLISLGEDLVQGFYGIVLSHDKTKAIFKDDEIEMRAEDLKRWWVQSVAGKFDNEYWIWLAYVGVIHVRRGVKNAMMMSMWGWMFDFLSKALFIKTTPENASSLLQAFSRLSATSQALTADTYLETYLTGILTATGFSKNLLDKMVENEINDLVDAVK